MKHLSTCCLLLIAGVPCVFEPMDISGFFLKCCGCHCEMAATVAGLLSTAERCQTKHRPTIETTVSEWVSPVNLASSEPLPALWRWKASDQLVNLGKRLYLIWLSKGTEGLDLGIVIGRSFQGCKEKGWAETGSWTKVYYTFLPVHGSQSIVHELNSYRRLPHIFMQFVTFLQEAGV